jgi:CDGSH-type Zn-finger protein
VTGLMLQFSKLTHLRHSERRRRMAGGKGRRAKIVASKNGPYLVSGLEELTDSRGRELATEPEMALCRCGGSENKPHCDGTHFLRGFSGACRNTDEPKRTKDFVGEDITVHDNRWICSHIGNCYRGLPEVFRPGEKPWVWPDREPVERVIEIIESCPSGALGYTHNGVRWEGRDREPGITIDRNGAYQVVGTPDFEDAQGGLAPVSREHFSLCRCGESENKPFCDGTHRFCGFEDPEN